MFHLHTTAKMFFRSFFLFASVWYCWWEKKVRNWCILQKKYRACFFFFVVDLLWVQLGHVRSNQNGFCLLSIFAQGEHVKKRPFLYLVTLAFFFVVFFYHSEAYRKSCMKLKKNAKLEDDGEREVFFCLFKKKRNHKITEADQQKRVLYFWYKFAVFFFVCFSSI